MEKINILVVFGTRPEAIKMCPLINALKKYDDMNIVICLTGQHKEMLYQVMKVFGIKEDYNLNVMATSQSLLDITNKVMTGISDVIDECDPDLVLVHGDTTTSYAAAVAAFYKRIPIGHVEAGLRTYDMTSPFPEEFNRQSVDMISSLCFAPTQDAYNNLISEGKDEDCIDITGNTVVDAIKFTTNLNYMDENLEWIKGFRMILLTMHRRESIGEPMKETFEAVREIVDRYKDVKVIYPVHMNPEVRKYANLCLNGYDRIRLIEPLDLVAFHNYMKNSYIILTDSGGIQEEAPTLGKPVVVLRNKTERPEGILAGVSYLAGTKRESIIDITSKLIENKEIYYSMSRSLSTYGDGHASQKICQYIRQFFSMVVDK